MKKYVVLEDYSEDFVPKHIFECGQCFRWNRENDGSYTLVSNKRVINVSKKENKIYFDNVTDEEFSDIWFDFFDLGRDYSKIKKELSLKDKYLKDATKYGNGIRILKQDLWECLVSFIISANNNIPRIQGIIDRLCRAYGEKIEYNGKTYFSFPEAEKIVGDISFLRAGYRDLYIKDACSKVLSGELDLENIKCMTTQDAKKSLLTVKGVGPKVADCILLFGLAKHEVFPVDVWVKRCVETLYTEEALGKNTNKFAQDKFGNLAGFAQQYLFYCMRESGLNVTGGIKDA